MTLKVQMCLDSEVLSKSLFTFDTRFDEFTVWEKRLKIRMDFKIGVLCNIAVCVGGRLGDNSHVDRTNFSCV